MWAEILGGGFKPRSSTGRGRLHTLLPLLCLFLFLPFSGCDHTSQPITGTWTISGKTYLLGSADPLPGVKITCAEKSTTSGPDGSYEFRDIPEGTQTITAEKENCDDYSYSIEVNSDRKFYIYLRLKTARLWGYVTNALDGPIEGAKVEMTDFADYTDAAGRYELSTVPRSMDTLFVTHPDYNSYKTAVFPDSAERQVDVVLTKGRTIEEFVTEDTYVYQSQPNASYAASQYLYLSTASSTVTIQQRHIYVNFTFPELLRDERVSLLEANLQLTIYGQPPATSYRTYAVGSSWTAPTLRFSNQPPLGALLASGSVGGGLAGSSYSVLGTDGLRRLLQDWRAKRPIYGISIQGGAEYPGVIVFYSTEAFSYQPRLTFKVQY